MSKKQLPTIDLTLREDPQALTAWIKAQALDLGFSDCAIAYPDTRDQMPYLQAYLAKGYHGDMHFLTQNHDKRADPTLLVPDTQAIICVRMDFLQYKPIPRTVPDQPELGIIARYARGRDYHKTMRGRLKQLAQRIEDKVGAFNSRPFSDSAPIFEKALAEQAGMGWTGKHTLLINRKAGSFFVLGELFCGLPLVFDSPTTEHCGSCSACIQVCPTQAIVAPYQLNASRCISYLTIEYKGSIPLELRQPIGNRIFGCDDCQLICPWNKYAQVTQIEDFLPRHQLDRTTLLDFWQWDEATFLAKTEGSPLRRTGFLSLKRNIAVALGNAPYSVAVMQALQQEFPEHDALVNEHVAWAIQQQQAKKQSVL